MNEVNATFDSFSIIVRLRCCCEGIPSVNNLRKKRFITVQDFRGSYCSGWEAEKFFFLCLLLSHLEHQPIRYHIQGEFSISQSFLWDISIGTPRDVLSYLGSSHSINLTRLTFSSSECIYPCVQICTVFVNLIYAPVLIQYQRSW